MNIISTPEQSHFTQVSRQAIQAAYQQAVHMNATEVHPENLFLGALTQDGDAVVEVLSSLRMDREVLRRQAKIIFPLQDIHEGDARNVSLSNEVQACLEWATAFAAHLHASSVQLEHILLSSLRHQRLQPLLELLLSQEGRTPPSYVTDISGQDYTASMDQLIYSRVRMQDVEHFNAKISRRILSSFARPSLAFSDIVGFHEVKQELRGVIEYLKKPRTAQNALGAYHDGLLLIGTPGNSRTLLVQALAGEAVVPLLSLSMPTLFEMTSALSRNEQGTSDIECSTTRSFQTAMEMMAQRGRDIIHHLFEQGKYTSPCVILIDELDLLAKPEMREVGEQWQKQLAVEMDGRDSYRAAVIATTSRLDKIDQSLLLHGRFHHRATLDGSATRPFEAGLTLCFLCQHEVPGNWKYCGFCGTALASVCPSCGSISPDVKGVHFCPECGGNLAEKKMQGDRKGLPYTSGSTKM